MPSFNTVRSLQRGLEVLTILNLHGPQKAQQVGELTGLPRPTAYRLLESLASLGYVTKSAEDTWLLTLKVKSLSAGFNDSAWVTQIALPAMTKLAKQILWPIDLVTFDAYEMVVRESTHPISPFSLDVGMVGHRLPMLDTAAGRAYLSFCPHDERTAIIDALSRSDRPQDLMARNPEAVERIVSRTLKLGCGYRVRGFKSQTSSFSVPIIHDNTVIACLTLIWIASALDFHEASSRYLDAMRNTADEIATAMTAGSKDSDAGVF